MNDIQYTRNFSRSEFIRASKLPWNDIAEFNARRFATEILQPLRDALGFAICITDYYSPRAHTTAHPHARAVDIVACDRDPARLDAMFDWLRTNARHTFGELIHERNHLHITLPDTERGTVLIEPSEGIYVAALAPAAGAAGIVVLGLIFALLWMMIK